MSIDNLTKQFKAACCVGIPFDGGPAEYLESYGGKPVSLSLTASPETKPDGPGMNNI